MLVNKPNLQALFMGYNTVFNTAFDAQKPLWNQVAMLVPSVGAKETYGWMGQSTGFREWVGDRVIQGLELHDYTIKNKKFENTVGVLREQIEDDTYGVLNPLMGQLGQDAALHPDDLVFALLAAGTTELCYDGQYFFDTDHPVRSAGGSVSSVSNTAGGAGSAWYLLDTSRMVKPLIYQKRKDYKFVSLTNETDQNVFGRDEYLYGVDGRGNAGFGLWQLAYHSKQSLTADNYASARAAMQSFKGDNGRTLGVKPTLLVVGPADEKKALEVVQAQRLANGADNVMAGTTRVLVVPHLS